MKQNSKTRKIISGLLAMLMIVTMIPTFMLSSFADGTDSASLPASVSGEWEHKTVNNGGDHQGKGENYISMWFKNTSFVLMQTSDNQSFELNYELWAMKNDGINTCQINNIVFLNSEDLSMTETSWKEISSCYGIDDPTAYTLPGTFGSGYQNQLAKNIAKWNGSAQVTANGSAKYTVPINITYHSGATGMAPKAHSTAGDDEMIMMDITVVDLRELLNMMDTAKTLTGSDKLSEEQKNAISKVITKIEADYILDGSIAYTQEEVDSLTGSLKNAVYADFTEYNKALEKAEIVLDSPYYTEEAKATINAAVADKDSILASKVNEQGAVDAATQKIIDALSSITKVLPPVNNIDDSNPSESGSFVISRVKNTDKDSIYITLSKKEIYLDITERLENVGLRYDYTCNFGKDGWYDYKQYYAGPLSTDCVGSSKKQIASAASPANYDTYFKNYGNLDEQITKTLDERGELSNKSSLSLSYTFDGAPLKTTGDGEKVYIGLYGRYTDKPWIGSMSTYTTENSGDYTIATEIPNFMLYVYDKAPLKAALENAYTVVSDATNYDDFLALISEGERIYGTRAVTDTQVKNITDAINNFVFTYSVVASTADSATGLVELEVVEGQNTAGNEYTSGSVLKLTAVPAADYEFNGWEDKSNDIIRTVTVDGNYGFVANFKFVSADYSNLQNAIADIPSDTSVYSEETVAALNEALKNANTVIDAGYGKSNQSVVDEATKQITDAVAGLVKVVFRPCNYTYLDIAIEYSEKITNDGRYKTDAWNELVDAITAAKAIDRNLTDESEDNQKMIDDAVIRLSNAVNALEDPANQNFADTTSLETVKDSAQAEIGDTNDGRYTDDAWNDYQTAIDKANDLINNPPFDNEDGRQQIEDAKKAIEGAQAVLKDPANQNFADTTSLETAKDGAQAEIGDTNDGRYTDDAWNDYQTAIDKANDLINNPPFDNEDGRQQIEDAKKAIKDAQAALKDPANQNEICDYSALDTAKDKASNIMDTNDGRYTEDAWNKYKDALVDANGVKDGMYNDDSGINQKVINDAASALENALTELENTRNHVVEIKDENGNTTDTIFVGKDSNTTVGDIKDKLTLPEDTTDKKYIGWEDESGNLVTDNTSITGDTVLSPAYDLIAITPGNDSQIKVDTEYTFMVGITVGENTVAELKAQLQNDGRTIIVIKDGKELADDALVGTGYIVQCVSKADHSVVYEEATVILYGDVNGDGIVDSADKTLLHKKGYMFDSSAIADGSVYMTAADLNHDGVIDAFDVALLDLQLSGAKTFDQTVEYYK